LAPLLNNDRKSIELLNALLFSLPGTPVLYYGDEIGLGENIYLGDRNGVRTPMQWSSDKNAGFSRANPQSLYLPIILDPAYHYEACNVEAQLSNPHSLLWWMRRLLSFRKRWRALGEGKCEFLQPENHKILSYVLRHENEIILVVANLSRFTQPVELDLSAFKQMVPIELFGRMKFPAITDAPYFLTLGPHNFFWFSLEAAPQSPKLKPVTDGPVALPVITVAEDWQEIFSGGPRAQLEALLPGFLQTQRWFGGSANTIKFVTLKEHFAIPMAGGKSAVLAFLQVDYVEAIPEIYEMPLALYPAGGGEPSGPSESRLAAINQRSGTALGVLGDALAEPAFAGTLLEAMRDRDRLRNERAGIESTHAGDLRRTLAAGPLPNAVIQQKEEGNTLAIYQDRLVFKFYRRLNAGMNPELEIGRHLAAINFQHSPHVLGALEYSADDGTNMTLAIARTFISYAKNAWQFTLDEVSRYYDRVFSSAAQGQSPELPPVFGPLKLLQHGAPTEPPDQVGSYLESARLLGVRTAELHLALAAGDANSEFVMEPMTPYYLRSVFQTMRYLAVQNLRLLQRQIRSLPPDLLPVAQHVGQLEPLILKLYRPLIEQQFDAGRIRVNGDCQLGKILWTGRDFVFHDFEGDVLLPISERRLKRSPLSDVARLVRSFHHAAYAGFHHQVELGAVAREDLPKFEPWVRHWYRAVGRAYLQAYCDAVRQSALLPADEDKLRTLLLAYVLHQVMDELGRELRARSDNVRAPLQAIINLTEEQLPVRTPVAAEAKAEVEKPKI
jgi:maltose alpha-D-glucosyltransferase/alpha-amylase